MGSAAEGARVEVAQSRTCRVALDVASRKHIHWASGTAGSEAERGRLRSLAAGCGIEGRLDGPFAHRVSLTVSGRSGH